MYYTMLAMFICIFFHCEIFVNLSLKPKNYIIVYLLVLNNAVSAGIFFILRIVGIMILIINVKLHSIFSL
jgi:hypothetical protein